MKISTVERLSEAKIMSGFGMNLLLFFSSVIYIGLLVKFYTDLEWFDSFETKTTKWIVIAYFLIIPLIYAKDAFIFLLRFKPSWYGSIILVITAEAMWFCFTGILCYLVGVLFIALRGIAVSLISFIAMAIYNIRISEINKLSGDLTAYVNDPKFIKKLDNIYESIDIFCELHWISQKKYDEFIKIYSVFCGFAESANSTADNLSEEYTANTFR